MNYAKQNTIFEHCSDKLTCSKKLGKSAVVAMVSIVIFTVILSVTLLSKVAVSNQKAKEVLQSTSALTLERQCNNQANRTGYVLGCKNGRG